MTEFVVENRRFIVTRAGPKLSEGELAAFEAQISMRLPPQLRSFYLRCNGGLPRPIEVPEDKSVWVRLRWREGAEAAQVGPATSVRALFRINADPPVDFLRTWNDFKARIPKDCLCFSNDPGGSLFLIGIGEHNPGKIYYWARAYEADVGAGERPSYDNIADVAGSFEKFLLALREEPGDDEPLDAWVRRVYSR